MPNARNAGQELGGRVPSVTVDLHLAPQPARGEQRQDAEVHHEEPEVPVVEAAQRRVARSQGGECRRGVAGGSGDRLLRA